MTPAETIRAAIDRLERQRDAAFSGGEWRAHHGGPANGNHSYVTDDGGVIVHITANDGSDEEYRAPTADLIVTLHRTIDAQLAILRWSEARALSKIDNGGKITAVWAHERQAITLAHAILGEDTK